MFRRKARFGPAALSTLAITALLATGCIFSPDEKRIDDTPPPSGPPESFEETIGALSDAYQRRDIDKLAALLANDPDNKAEYLFFLSEPTDQGETQWGYTEEVRIHQRMFEPENLPPGEPPVPAELWLQGIDITLTRITPFTERTDLYESPSNPGGLDPAKWKAMDARYQTFVFFTTAGEVDFRVEGQANFVVIEDLAKSTGDAGKFLIYRWEDLDVPGKTVAQGPTT